MCLEAYTSPRRAELRKFEASLTKCLNLKHQHRHFLGAYPVSTENLKKSWEQF